MDLFRWNLFNKYSIRNRLIIFFLITMLIPSVLITLVMYYRSTIILGEKKGDSIVNGLIQTSRLMDSILSDAEYQLTSLIVNPDNFRQLHEFEKLTDDINDSSKDDVWNRIHTILLSNRNIESIYIYLYDKKLMFTSYESRKVLQIRQPEYYEWLKVPINNQTNSSGWVSSYGIPPNVSSSIGSVLLLKKKLKNISMDKPIGEACIVLSEQTVRNTLLDSIREGKNGVVMVLDSDGSIISPKTSRTYTQDIRNEPFVKRILKSKTGFFVEKVNTDRMLIAYTTSDLTGWKYISMVPFADVILNVKEIRNLALWVNLLSVVMAIILAWIFSQSVYNPIKKLKDSMKEAESGNLKIQITDDRRDEFGMLNRGFNRMINQIQRLVDELYHEKLLKKEAELRNLETQINPHFLYNTLDSIHWMSRLKKMDEVSKLTFSLSNFYRLSLGGGKETITVKATIDLIQEYLYIQKSRYGDKFSVEMDLDESLYNYYVLRLIVQPLVENAIYHGIEKKKGPGRIFVKLCKWNQGMAFIVQDNGIGMTADKLQEVQKSLEEKTVEDGNNFALVNIHKRVQMYYGEEYGLKIDSEQNAGTTVHLVLPRCEQKLKEVKANV